MNRLSSLIEIKWFLALAFFTPFVVSADEKEKSKDGSSTKQVHYPVSAIDLIAQLKKDEEALFKIKSLYVRAKGTIQQTQASSKEFERNGQNAQLNI
ncbi:hypothetical protein K2Y11_05535 [bacterium]|nr:hypothetical protein [bacterium]